MSFKKWLYNKFGIKFIGLQREIVSDEVYMGFIRLKKDVDLDTLWSETRALDKDLDITIDRDKDSICGITVDFRR